MKRDDPDVNEPHDRLDDWWAKIFAISSYAQLSKVVKAALSIFSGPQVESSFNTMGDVVDDRAHNMHISTYNAVQNVRTWVNNAPLENEDKKIPRAVQLFR